MKHGRYTTIEGGQEVSQKRLIVDVRTNGQKFMDWLVFPRNMSKVMVGMAVLCLVFPFGLPILLFVFLAMLDTYSSAAQYLPMRYPAWCKVADPGLLHPGTDAPMEPTGIMYFGVIDAKDPYERGKQVFLSADDLTRHMLVLGTTGSGKAQPLGARVHTPSGWKLMGDIAVGDLVSTPDGGSAAVSGVFPQGEIDVYRVTFTDGRTTEACGDHLWEIQHHALDSGSSTAPSRAALNKPQVMSTLELASQLARGSESISIPLPAPVEKPARVLPLHPYLLGVLLGSGEMRNNLSFEGIDVSMKRAANVSTIERNIAAESDKHLSRHTTSIWSACSGSQGGQYQDGGESRNLMDRILGDLGLREVSRKTKCIPEMYRESSIEQRQMLLQGLLASVSTPATFSTSSVVLAEQVQDLVWSLGGSAAISSTNDTRNILGLQKRGGDCYTVDISRTTPPACKEQVAESTPPASRLLGIAKVELVGKKHAQCILVDHPQHLYITDDYIVTHNSEFLKGMTFNVLCWASGFFVADAKADNKLPTDMYSQVHMFGRDYDFLVVNYLLGGKSPTEISNLRERLSNGLQPATAADADTLVQMTSNIMVKASGDSKTWQDRGLNVYRGICRALAYKRDKGELTLSIETLRNYLALDKIEELYIEGYKLANGGPWPSPYLGVKSYLEVGLPGFQIETMMRKHGLLNEQAEEETGLAAAFAQAAAPRGGAKKPPTVQVNGVFDQHGYRADQVYPALSLLIDTYGHIFKRKHPEVDLEDVVVNNRICVSLIPSLEKGSQEQESLGKLNLALLRVMMARALGSSIEGDVEQNVDAKITAAATPFALFLDEFAYQFAEGIALTAAQARSLNFFLCALAQDLEKLTEGERAAEAGAMMANQATKFFMKILGSDKTHDLALKTLGEADVAVAAGFELTQTLFADVRRDTNYKVEKRPRVARKTLEELASGFAAFAYRERANMMRTFYPSPDVPRSRYPRINRFLQIHDLGETTLLTTAIEITPNSDKIALDRIRDILDSGKAPNYPELITSDIVQSIAAAGQAMNPHTPAVERGIVLYQAALQALHHARAGASLLGRGAGGGSRNKPDVAPAAAPAAPAAPVAAPTTLAPQPQEAFSAAVVAELEQVAALASASDLDDGAQSGAEMDEAALAAELAGELGGGSEIDTSGVDELLTGLDPFDEVMRVSPPITRRPKESVFAEELGLSPDAATDDAAAIEAAVLATGDADPHLDAEEFHELDDDVHMVTDEPQEEVRATIEGLTSAEQESATTPTEAAQIGTTLARSSDEVRAELQVLSRTKVENDLIDRMGPEVVGLKGNAKDELVNLEVSLGSTPEDAVDAAHNTEKAVAKGLSLLDNNKTKTSSADIETLFSELANLVDNK